MEISERHAQGVHARLEFADRAFLHAAIVSPIYLGEHVKPASQERFKTYQFEGSGRVLCNGSGVGSK